MTIEQTPEYLDCFYQPGFYPHPVNQIEMIQTHISWLFLTGDYVYKIKKPVNFGFLDFSTSERRKHFCEQELILNRRLADDIYLEVLSINKTADSYTMTGHGEAVDYCLKMKQFDQDGLLSNKLTSNQFNPVWMDELATDIVLFHNQAEINRDIDHIGLLSEHINANLDIATQHLASVISQATWNQLSDFANRELIRLTPLLKQRQQNDFIRRCHGDLHLRNITLINHHPQPFDCIEFNDLFSTIDMMNDAAFLIMDCFANDRADLAMRFLSRFLEQNGDYTGLKLLRLYLFYRAGVRGKVACLLAAELDENDNEAQLNDAKHYFDLAHSFTKEKEPCLLAVGGLSGSGKSHLALLGCGQEQAIIIRSDATRKRIAPNYPNLDLYSQEMHIITYRAMFKAANTALQAGFSVILDATFLHLTSRQQVYNLAKECEVPLHFFWLDIEKSILRERISQRQIAANDISDADLRVLELQLEEYQPPSEPWIQLIPSNDYWPSIETP